MEFKQEISNAMLAEQMRIDDIINVLARKIKNLSNEKDINYYLNTAGKNLTNQFKMLEVEDAFPYYGGGRKEDEGERTIIGLIELQKGEEWDNNFLGIKDDALVYLSKLGLVEITKEVEYFNKFVKATEKLKPFLKEFETTPNRYSFYEINKALKNLVYTEIVKYEPTGY